MSKLKEFRKMRGMTQAQLSELSGVNIGIITKVEQGISDIGNITLRNAVKLAETLQISAEDLLN